MPGRYWFLPTQAANRRMPQYELGLIDGVEMGSRKRSYECNRGMFFSAGANPNQTDESSEVMRSLERVSPSSSRQSPSIL